MWLEQGARAGIWARHHTLRRGWDPPEHTLGLGEIEPDRPLIAAHGGGDVTAVWIGQGSAWTGQYIHGLGWGRVAALESADMPVLDVAIDASGEAGTLYLWSQGDRDPVQLIVREAP